jgi:ABC-type sugar transport system ATPase subunit
MESALLRLQLLISQNHLNISEEEIDRMIAEDEKKRQREDRLAAVRLSRNPLPSPTEKQNALFQAVWRRMGKGAVMVICGTRGGGKTSIARLAQWELIHAGNPGGTYRIAQTVMESCANLYSDFPKQTPAALSARNWLYRTRFLALDEVQDILDSQTGSKLVRDVIRQRHSAGLPTLLISNLPAQTSKLCQTVLDRVQDGGFIYEVKWPSFRKPTNELE